MKANNISGEKLKIQSNSDFIESKEYGIISKNGTHQAIKVGDTIFDNFHPNGIPYAMV